VLGCLLVLALAGFWIALSSQYPTLLNNYDARAKYTILADKTFTVSDYDTTLRRCVDGAVSSVKEMRIYKKLKLSASLRGLCRHLDISSVGSSFPVCVL
jgi:hypothetical protein